MKIQATPTRYEITEFITELIQIIEQTLSANSSSDWKFMQLFSDSVLANWQEIIVLIRRRVFNDDLSGSAFIDVAEIDYLHADAMSAMHMGALLPVIDFDITAPLG